MALNIENCRKIWRVYIGHSRAKNYASVVVTLHSSLEDIYIYIYKRMYMSETAKITLISGKNFCGYLQRYKSD
jgi:hypothetical protein